MVIQINLTGNAYLQVQKPDLTFIYTLSRQFHVNELGQIVTAEGYLIQSPITVPAPFNEPMRISNSGAVTVLHTNIWTAIGQLIVAGFLHADMLEDLGNGYYGETDDSGVASTGNPGVEPFENVIIYGLVSGSANMERPLAVLNIAKYQNINDFIERLESISYNMSLHTDLFPNPNPSLLVFNANIEALRNSQAVVSTGLRGSVQARNIKKETSLDNVHSLLNYVQDLADSANDVQTAIDIIIASGFDVKTVGIRIKDILEVKHGPVANSVILTAKAIEHAGAYKWQMNTVAHIWVDLPTTLVANTIVKNLTHGSIVNFRYSAITDEGEQDWSPAISFVIA